MAAALFTQAAVVKVRRGEREAASVGFPHVLQGNHAMGVIWDRSVECRRRLH